MGVSSLEELLPAAECCTFRGSLVKLNVRTGAIIWQTYTLPDNGRRLGGYSGAAIWGSSPAIDILRGFVYVGTGNLYLAPPEVLKCQAAQNNRTMPPAIPDQCFGEDVHFDSILALNMDSGKLLGPHSLEATMFSISHVWFLIILIVRRGLTWMLISERRLCC